MMPDDVRHKLYLLIHGAQTLKDAIHAAKHAESTISEHWDTLVKYGRLVHTVLEFGAGFSTLAWLASAGHVTSYDVEPLPWMDRLQELAEGRLTAAVADDMLVEPREVDLLYIDTIHTYAQLSAELNRHGRHAGLIVLHDVESFRDENAPLTRQYCPGDRGLMPAVREFCATFGYKVLEHRYNQHGLLILERP
jgi:hypothetical protein